MSKKILTIAITCFSCFLLTTSFAFADKPEWAYKPDRVEEKQSEQEARKLKKEGEKELRKSEDVARKAEKKAEQEARKLKKRREKELRKTEDVARKVEKKQNKNQGKGSGDDDSKSNND